MKGITLIIASLWLCVASAGQAASPVWKVEKNGQTLYLGGTIHVLAASDYPLPAAFDRAYGKSQRLVFETDLGAMQDPLLQMQMAQAMMYRDGRTLKSVLSPRTWNELSRFMQRRSLPIESLSMFTAGGVSLTLTMLELQRLGLAETGVDKHYYQKAAADAKPSHGFETPQQQIQFLASLGEGNEDNVIRYTLRDIAALEPTMRQLKSLWRSGDNKGMVEMAIAPFRAEFPAVYKSILVDRNLDWMEQIDALIKTAEVEFVLVGALHLAGKEGLVTQLRQRGYRLSQLP